MAWKPAANCDKLSSLTIQPLLWRMERHGRDGFGECWLILPDPA